MVLVVDVAESIVHLWLHVEGVPALRHVLGDGLCVRHRASDELQSALYLGLFLSPAASVVVSLLDQPALVVVHTGWQVQMLVLQTRVPQLWHAWLGLSVVDYVSLPRVRQVMVGDATSSV